jgi:hypothetical protein
LEEQARGFADQLTDTVHAVAPSCRPFRAVALKSPANRFYIRQEPDTGIPLTVENSPLLTLKVFYRCTWDHTEHFLAVEASTFRVYAGPQATGEPLFRYDYVRRPRQDHPSAHLQVHAHRDGIAHVMSRAGRSTRRARRRADDDATPAMSELHFPVGGPRYRPCLEDVLEMLVSELGVDCPEGAREAIQASRETWRRQQLRSAVRDAPADAAAVLTTLGYTVEPPTDGHAQDNLTRLREH